MTVGIFVANAFGDRSYYDAAREATTPLEEEYDAKVTTYEGKLETQNFGPLLQDAADSNEIVFVVGNQAVDATVKAAADNPETTFIFVNGVAPSEDVVSATFRYQESCYIGGVVAAEVNAKAGEDTVGWVGGFEAKPMADCAAGFAQGINDHAPGTEIISRYVGSFSDPGKGLETGKAVAQAGAHAVYCTAGLSSQGVVEAAGSGSDIVPILASAEQVPDLSPAVINDHTDVLILDSASRYVDGTLERGEVKTYGFAEGAFEILYNDAMFDATQQEAVQAVLDDVNSGAVVPKAS